MYFCFFINRVYFRVFDDGRDEDAHVSDVGDGGDDDGPRAFPDHCNSIWRGCF